MRLVRSMLERGLSMLVVRLSWRKDWRKDLLLLEGWLACVLVQ